MDNQTIFNSYKKLRENLNHTQAVKVLASNTGKSNLTVRRILNRFGIDGNREKSHSGFESSPASPNQIKATFKLGKKIEPLPVGDGIVFLTDDPDEVLDEFSNQIEDNFLEIEPDTFRDGLERISKRVDAMPEWKKEGWAILEDKPPYCGASVRFTPETSSDYEITHKESKEKPLHNQQDGHQLSDKMERWLILPDMQIPYHDIKTLDAVLEYASDVAWDGIIQLGDFCDWDFCSRWTKENQRKIEGARFLREYDIANSVLDKIQDSVRKQNPTAKITILEGNHDWRIENVIDKTPALEGLIEMESNLRLKERDILFWRYWTHRKPYVIGNAWFIHGEYIGNGHAKKTADNYHRNVFYGHTHDRQSHTKSTVYGDSVQCESMGTLSVFELEYMGHKPSAWMQCFGEFFFQPNGNFNHYVTNIINHQFIAINGQKYGA